ncbi:MAG: DUF6489 family protein [Hyphomonadaceae bacterium]|nr:DUF6489 family protein [Hyphomonadaceae bacterium]
MKMTVNLECTPEEARRFVGLPDVSPLNEMLVAEMTNRAQENLKLMAPDAMMRSWMAFGGQAQDAFVKMMANTTGARSE